MNNREKYHILWLHFSRFLKCNNYYTKFCYSTAKYLNLTFSVEKFARIILDKKAQTDRLITNVPFSWAKEQNLPNSDYFWDVEIRKKWMEYKVKHNLKSYAG